MTESRDMQQQGQQQQPPQSGQNAPPAISEAEFEEVMGRNRTVSSSAIARAVNDAATGNRTVDLMTLIRFNLTQFVAGDYGSAIETLVTAISLIKQSKVAHDERCKILVSSLQDTLHGIEAKSYGSRRGNPFIRLVVSIRPAVETNFFIEIFVRNFCRSFEIT